LQQAAAGTAQLGAAGAAQVGAQATGAAQVGAHAGAQQSFFFDLRLLIQSRRENRCFFALPQHDGCGQQDGAGAQQLGAAGAAQAGAQAAGAAQVGAHAAGAAHDGAGAQQLGAGAQQLLFLLNRPASALFRPAKHTSAAVIQATFISRLLDIQAERERDARATVSRQTPCPADSAGIARRAFASLTLLFVLVALRRLANMRCFGVLGRGFSSESTMTILTTRPQRS
jgi:hypothetical protein